jgi:hypothetical protein
VPYDPGFQRFRAHHSALFWGASIAALTHLAGKRGYVLLGSNREGHNAFFVREDHAAQFEGRIADRAPRPSRYRESRDESGRLTHARALDRLALIADCAAHNVLTGETAPLGRLGDLYSPGWIAQMAGQPAQHPHR